MKSKQADADSLQLTPYKASIDRSLPKHVMFIGCSGDADPESMAEFPSDKQIEDCFLWIFHESNHLQNPARLLEAMDGLKFLAHVTDYSMRSRT